MHNRTYDGSAPNRSLPVLEPWVDLVPSRSNGTIKPFVRPWLKIMPRAETRAAAQSPLPGFLPWSPSQRSPRFLGYLELDHTEVVAVFWARSRGSGDLAGRRLPNPFGGSSSRLCGIQKAGKAGIRACGRPSLPCSPETTEVDVSTWEMLQIAESQLK